MTRFSLHYICATNWPCAECTLRKPSGRGRDESRPYYV